MLRARVGLLRHDRLVTGQCDAYVEPSPRLVDEVPGMRAEFERVGGGAVLNNSPYDLAAAALCVEEAGGLVTDAYGSRHYRPLLGSDAEFQMSVFAASNPYCIRGSSRSWMRGSTGSRLEESSVASLHDAPPSRQPHRRPHRPGPSGLPRAGAIGPLGRLPLTPLKADDVADLKLAVTEAASGFVGGGGGGGQGARAQPSSAWATTARGPELVGAQRDDVSDEELEPGDHRGHGRRVRVRKAAPSGSPRT